MIIALVIVSSMLVNETLASLTKHHDEESMLLHERNLGGGSKSRKHQISRSGSRKNDDDDDDNNNNDNNDNDDNKNNNQNNNNNRRRRYDDDNNHDDTFLDDDQCVDPQAPIYVENKNIVIRCVELNDKSKLFACSWPTVKNRCRCKCRKFDGGNDPAYDDVYKYRNDDFSSVGGNQGGGGGRSDGGNNNNNDDVITNCENVNHPFSIYRDYEKVLVYCADLETNEFRYACNRDRPRRKCPASCNLCKPRSNHGDDYVDYTDKEDDDRNENGSSKCVDVTNRFNVYLNSRKIQVVCSDLTENTFRTICRREKGKTNCPVTCGICSSDNDDNKNDYFHYVDDNASNDANGFDDATFQDDEIKNFFDGTYDDDANIIYFDDKTGY